MVSRSNCLVIHARRRPETARMSSRGLTWPQSHGSTTPIAPHGPLTDLIRLRIWPLVRNSTSRTGKRNTFLSRRRLVTISLPTNHTPVLFRRPDYESRASLKKPEASIRSLPAPQFAFQDPRIFASTEAIVTLRRADVRPAKDPLH